MKTPASVPTMLPILRTCPTEVPAVPRTPLLTLQALREAPGQAGHLATDVPDVRALAWRASLLSERLKATASFLVPCRDPSHQGLLL